MEKRLKRLLYQVTYRGTRELEKYLLPYFEEEGVHLSEPEIDLWEELLVQPETDLMDIFFELKLNFNQFSSILSKIRKYHEEKISAQFRGVNGSHSPRGVRR